MIKLRTPLNGEDVSAKKLRVGDEVLLSGIVYTMRDEAHKLVLKNGPPVSLKDSVIYHCGPIVRKVGGEWKVYGAGPTTSARMEMYESEMIAKFGLRGIIGKGGMGEKTRKAMKGYGCVYFAAVGGASALIAKKTKVKNVYFEELGEAEAMWELEFDEVPLIVGIDAKGRSVYE